MGLDQCVYRRCVRQAALRLDYRRSDLRYVRAAEDEAAGADRIHAGSAVRETAAVPAPLEAGRQVQRHLHGMGASSEGFREMGRAGLPMGAALRAEVWESGSGVLAVGGVERAGWRILARHAGGISQAVRLRGGWGKACAADGPPPPAPPHPAPPTTARRRPSPASRALPP